MFSPYSLPYTSHVGRAQMDSPRFILNHPFMTSTVFVGIGGHLSLTPALNISHVEHVQ